MINKKFAFNAIIGTVAVAAIMLFAGCLNPFEPQTAPDKAPTGKGYFAFSLSEARTIRPETIQDDFMKYRLDFFVSGNTGTPDIIVFLNPDDLDNNQLSRNKLIELPVGLWNLNVTAYINFESQTNDALNQPAARGSLSGINVIENEIAIAGGAIKLYPIPDEGNGTFSWDITYPDVTKTATMTIEPIVQWGTTPKRTYTFTDKPEDTPLGDLEVRTTGSLELESGTYRVTFDLVDTEDHRLESSEILQIYRNLVSHHKEIFKEEYFIIKRVTAIKFEQGVTGVDTNTPLKLVGTVEPADATFTDIVWSVKDAKTTGAKIDEDGNLTATDAAMPYTEITITAKIEHGAGYNVPFTDDFIVRVNYVLVTGIGLSENSVTLDDGKEKQITVTIDPPHATSNKLLIDVESEDPVADIAIVTYDPENLVITIEGKNPGTGVYKVKSEQGSGVTPVTLTVKVEKVYVTKINLSASLAFVPKGGSITLFALFSPSNATDKDLTFSSTRSDLISVGAKTGIVEVTSTGDVNDKSIITVTSMGGDPAINGGKLEEECEVWVVADDDSVTGVSLQIDRMRLAVGETTEMIPILQPEGAESILFWNSGDDEVVALVGGNGQDVGGEIIGKKAGQAVIVVNTMTGGRMASCLVEVYDPEPGNPPVTGLTLDPAAKTLDDGAEMYLTPVFTPAEPGNKTLVWKSSNPAVVKVDQTGLITAVSPSPIVGGNRVPTIITAVSEDAGYVASSAITVISTPVERIELNMTELNMTTTKPVQLIVTVYPPNATYKSLEWSTINDAVATVVDGVVTYKGGGPGTTYISVKSVDNPAASNMCLVGPISGVAASTVSLHTNKLSIAAGESVTLLPTVTPDDAEAYATNNLYWHSADDTIVTVNNGVVSPAIPFKAGTATIIVMTKNNGCFAECEVTTYQGKMASGITLNTKTLTLRSGTGTQVINGRTATLIATLTGGSGKTDEVMWKSDNTGIATVVDGVVTGMGTTGTTTITATAVEGGHTATCSVTVTTENITVTELNLSTNSLNLEAGEIATLTPYIVPATSTTAVEWYSLDPTIADVNNGVVSAKTTGVGRTTTIIATAVNGGFRYNCAVTVRAKGAAGPAVNGVKLNINEMTIVRGRGAELHAFVGPMANGQSVAANKNVFWISSNTAIASVSQTGVITTTTAGMVTIKVTTEDGGYTDECLIVVQQTASGTAVSGLNINMTYLTLNTRYNILSGELNSGRIITTILPVDSTGKSTATNQNLKWYNSNPAVATIDTATGMVTATKTLGKTLIRVTTIDGGYTRSVEVNVVAEGTGNTPPPIQAVGGITIPSRFYLEEEGQPHIIPVTVTPANAANKDLVWTISNPRITVDANGMISGSGTAAITATTVDGGKTSNKCFVITSPENVLIKGHSLGDFYMGRFDVWQEKWRTVMTGNTNNISATPSYFSSSPVGVEDQELRVVENVSWYEVLVFCNRLSVQEGLTPAYEMQASTGTTRTSDTSQWGIVPGGLDVRWNGVSIVAGSTGYRLPTLSQWAYAARGGASTYYWWGNDFDRNGGYVVWGTTHQVGMALPNPWGLFDMWGNVWKLLWDPISNNRRAARGAAYDSGNEGFREDFDGGAQPHQRDRTIGFRVMRPGTTQLEEVLIPASNGNVIIQDQFVSLSAFYMSAYQITQSLYQEVMGTNPSYFHGGSGREPVAGEAQGYRPVENVSWYNALVFCNRLSERDGLTPAYEMIPSTGGTTMTSNTTQWGNVPGISDARWNAVSIVAGSTGYRLPTENQWEYACRGGVTGVIYSFYYKTGGTGAAAGTNTWSNDFGWTSENAGNRTHQVGLKWPNGYGLYDMHGNVWEWVYDWLPGGYGTFRMMRGGTYTGSSGYTASTSRSSHNPHDRFNDLGLRLVRP